MSERDRWNTGEIFAAAWADGRRAWPQLLATDIAYKLLAFVILTPLVGLALRLGISLSGSSVLADQDILFFLLRPVGLVVMVVIAALSLTVIALEQACLMTISVGAAEDVRIGVAEALKFSLERARPVIGLAVRLTARCLLLAAPFLIGVALIYFVLLSDYDINYYLTERPPAFLLAIALVALLVAGLAWVLIPRLVGWGLALPLALFEGLAPKRALAESRQRVDGHRPPIAWVLVLWGAGAFVLSIAAPSIVLGLGRAVGPLGRSRVGLVLVLMLVIATLWALVNLLVTWVNAAAFSLLVIRLYEQFGGGRGEIASRFLQADKLGSARGVHFSLKKLLLGLLVLAVVAGGIGFFLLDGVKGNDDVLVIAHRGAAAVAPENTMASVEEALAQGADFVEIDVQETADGEIAVIHDSDFMKIAGVNLKIWDATWGQLEEIDVGSWFSPEFSDQRVPHLRDVIERSSGEAKVDIELKYYGHDENLEQRVVDIVEQLGAVDEVILMSLKYDAVVKMHALRPDWTVGLLTATAVGDLTALEADFLAVNAPLATRHFVRRAHQRDKDVYVWTINDPVQMFRMMNLGVDGIITDKPGLARSVIAQRAELNSLERLLVGVAALFGAAEPDPPASNDAG